MGKSVKQPLKRKTVRVSVVFHGVVDVQVPASAKMPDLLASKIAVSRIAATLDNPDGPEDPACEEYADDAGVTEERAAADWDQSIATVGGSWTCLGVLKEQP